MDEPDLVSLPKALLHDHLDGGLRVGTVLELAAESGYESLPAGTAAELRQWFHQGGSESLEIYLESFAHTVAVLQTSESLERAAYEAVVDLAADGVVYAELRFGPALHTQRGLALEDTVAAVWRGATNAMRETACTARLILTALRNQSDSEAIARLAVANHDRGVVGFDLAGPEASFPCDQHARAFAIAAAGNVPITVHAGEGDGPESIARALDGCRALRIGHGVRVADDCVIEDGVVVQAGRLATRFREEQIPMEVSVYSNLHTSMYPEPGAHPVGALHRFGCNVTINTDNRLMSDTSMSREFALLRQSQGFTTEDFHRVTRQAILAGFAPWSVREEILAHVDEVYAGLRD